MVRNESTYLFWNEITVESKFEILRGDFYLT